MRLRILRGPSAGRVVDLPEPEARALLTQGLVEQDTSLDGPSETTAEDVVHIMSKDLKGNSTVSRAVRKIARRARAGMKVP